MKNNKGFTILELITTIAIVVIIFGVILPSFTRNIKKAKVAADTETASEMATSINASLAYETLKFMGSGPVMIKNGTVVSDSKLIGSGFDEKYVRSKVDKDATFVIYGDNINGVERIVLINGHDEYDCWPGTATTIEDTMVPTTSYIGD